MRSRSMARSIISACRGRISALSHSPRTSQPRRRLQIRTGPHLQVLRDQSAAHGRRRGAILLRLRRRRRSQVRVCRLQVCPWADPRLDIMVGHRRLGITGEAIRRLVATGLLLGRGVRLGAVMEGRPRDTGGRHRTRDMVPRQALGGHHHTGGGGGRLAVTTMVRHRAVRQERVGGGLHLVKEVRRQTEGRPRIGGRRQITEVVLTVGGEGGGR